MSAPIRLCCLASGGGRTILNIQDRIDAGILNAVIDSVIVSRPDITAIDRCIQRGLPVRTPPATVSIDEWMLSELCDLRPDLTCLCGYLRLLPIAPWMIGNVVNIHPALLPNFGGKGMHGQHVHEAVLASGRQKSGCTVHVVDAQYDHGPTILQRSCIVHRDDTPDSLAARVFEAECDAYPAAIQLIAEGRVRINQGPAEIAQPGERWPDAIGQPSR
jgi:phosphoribosylglycinamide formyltransferase-1